MSFITSNVDFLRAHQTAPTSSVWGSQFGVPGQHGGRPSFMGQQSGFSSGQVSYMRPTWGGGGGNPYYPYRPGYPSHSGMAPTSAYPTSGSVYVIGSQPALTNTYGQTTQPQQTTANGSTVATSGTGVTGSSVRAPFPLTSKQQSMGFPGIEDRGSAYDDYLNGNHRAGRQELRDFSQVVVEKSRKKYDEAQLKYKALVPTIMKELASTFNALKNPKRSESEIPDQEARWCNEILPSLLGHVSDITLAAHVCRVHENERWRMANSILTNDEELIRMLQEDPDKLDTEHALRTALTIGKLTSQTADGKEHSSPWNRLIDDVRDQHGISGKSWNPKLTEGMSIPLYKTVPSQSQRQTTSGTTVPTTAPTTASATSHHQPGSVYSQFAQTTNDPYQDLRRNIWESGVQAMNSSYMPPSPYQQQSGYPPSGYSTQPPSSYIPHTPSYFQASNTPYHPPSPTYSQTPSYTQTSIYNPTSNQPSPYFTSQTTYSSTPGTSQRYYYR
ncbi:hypothetical protein IAT40_001512 [Kwoniella sp. CBS 6097]